MRYIYSILAVLLVAGNLQAQTANVTEGCVPLTVQFTAPTGLSDYFWDFQDMGAQSNLQNPQRIFTTPGTYNVTLNEGTSGGQVGTVTITVYPEIEINYSSNIPDICFPRAYDFTINPVAANGVTIDNFKWEFGNGATDNTQNPSYTYPTNNLGDRDIRLEIFATPSNCSVAEIVETVTVTRELNADFSATPSASCNIPLNVIFTPSGAVDEDATYTWDFGDGNTASGSNLQVHQYATGGAYTASLTVTKGECENSTNTIIYAGAPEASFLFNDTLCIDVITILGNNTPGTNFLWTFEPSVEVTPGSSVTQKSPSVIFRQAGYTTINMIAQVGQEPDCLIDTTFQVFIQDPTVEVTIDPYTSCISPMMTEITTIENYSSYVWNDVSGGRTYTSTYVEPERDSFYVNTQDTMRVNLKAITPQGCVAHLDTFHFWQYPEAHFYPSVHHGCAPLTVTFIDTSVSAEPIINYTYNYGNGDTQSFTTNDDHSYTFTQPGEYYVTLTIENNVGCVDESWAVLIEVGESLDMDFTLDQSDICYGESVTITAGTPDPRIDVFNMLTDDGRSHHCEGETSLTHEFITAPGLYDIKYTTVYNGCQNNKTIEDAINVKGPKAEAWYMINCNDPLNVMFADSSKNATSILWTFEPGITSDQANVTHTFPASGDYTVYLEAFNDATGCPSHTDSIVVHVRQVQALFDLPQYLCDNEEYALDGASSIDVDSTCFKGYTWSFVNNGRPRRVGVSSLQHVFPIPGEDIVTLEVEDINGCTHSLSDTVEVYTIQPNFTFDEPVCFPVEMTFTSTTMSDTSIVSYTWSHDSNNDEVLDEFGMGEVVNTTFDFFELNLEELSIYLEVEDAVGCSDVIQLNVDVYRPQVNIESEPGICIGDSIKFTATEIPGSGTNLTYEWDFANGMTSTDSVVTVPYNVAGNYEVTLNLTEGATGCQNEQTLDVIVTDYPVADFDLFSGGEQLGPDDAVCFPASVQFQDASTANNNPLSYFYQFTNSDGSYVRDASAPNPSLGFPGGEYNGQLVITSAYGCADTISKPFTVIQLSGELNAYFEDEDICRGDSILFELKNLKNVSSWEWDFGDGTVVEGGNPIEIPIGLNTNADVVTVSAILQTDGYACEAILSQEVEITGGTDTIKVEQWVERGKTVPISRLMNKRVSWVKVDTSLNQMTNSVTITSDTLKCLDLVAVTIEDCITTVYEISIFPRDLLDVPNLFTPNGDGANDYFNYVEILDYMKGTAVEEVVAFRVYDRWGNLVYDNETPNTGWDGWRDGSPAPAEVYGYFIQVRIKEQRDPLPPFKGDVTLIR